MDTTIQKLERKLAAQVRNRGRKYFQQGRVTITRRIGRTVDAEVLGSELYDVDLRGRKRTLWVDCTCAYCEEYFEPCKHIWATILALESENTLHTLGHIDRLEVEEFSSLPGYQWNGPQSLREIRDPVQATGDDGGEYVPVVRSGAESGRNAEWRRLLSAVENDLRSKSPPVFRPLPAGALIWYVVNIPESREAKRVIVDLGFREPKLNGDWTVVKQLRIAGNQIHALQDATDREVLGLLAGGANASQLYASDYYQVSQKWRLTPPMTRLLIPKMCRTGRCGIRLAWSNHDPVPLEWDDGPPWEAALQLRHDADTGGLVLECYYARDGERISLKEAELATGGLIFAGNRVSLLTEHDEGTWTHHLKRMGEIRIPEAQQNELLNRLLSITDIPKLVLPEDLRFEEVHGYPVACLKARTQAEYYGGAPRVRAELSFAYEGEKVSRSDRRTGIYQAERRQMILRHPAVEQAALDRLLQVGFRSPGGNAPRESELEIDAGRFAKAIRLLVAEGWSVEAEGKVFRKFGRLRLDVKSGIDWLELHGDADFEGVTANLPELIAALKRGEHLVRLGDGTFGLMPEDWLRRYGFVASLGRAEKDHFRFTRGQIGLLDALLEAQIQPTFDEAFARARNELRRFDGVRPALPSSGFKGELREYQQAGLGWLLMLQRLGLGGCLADDMGLGKTIMVLALLDVCHERSRARRAVHHGPSLVVVPRSIVSNWMAEARRFSPALRVLDATGAGREAHLKHLEDYDLVMTTYGTLRQDAALLKETEFEYVILDEAQMIKNPATASAKAARLLRARHRLAMSGTPIENHLGDLWSLFEFLNPGLLASTPAHGFTASALRNPDEETRRFLARALKPYILRRTKEQVANDLPEKTELTVYCDLEPQQRKIYDELRAHYRCSLLSRVSKVGLNRSKIQVLEALLRLRQAACHPGLIDPDWAAHSSAKLDLLQSFLDEVLEEGHKALVFSQFTKFLGLLRTHLDGKGTEYEYLDGQTRNRAEIVDRFQAAAGRGLFLISLKAGGLGLNLTAADYVFLLDPWWNPAVEAQAVDRAHRIGQERKVFAYRIVTRDTVEEKILELQRSKRDLADSIINADNSLMRNLAREDLELLLS
ncbi:MAG: DEAD/DEAH box helicase family protein [Acidobacteria bacterium]|nr:DEAD/DEAH box helicase family protein [Acidobacteriota bacterium]